MLWILKAPPSFCRRLASLVALFGAACAWAQTISISVGPDQALNYPSDMTILPDEHTTFIPPAAGSNKYLVFAAGNVGTRKGTVVLETTDLTTFSLASGYSSPVMSPPVAFTSCNPTYDSEFDENYSDPGSVLQDPTLPPGNLMMFYEAENHCPGGVSQQPYYATIGFARSSDNGVTWPQPENGALGGPNRYPVLKLSAPEPASEPVPTPMGNAIPAAFVDKNNYVYVIYVAPPGPGLVGDGKLRVARAQLGGAGHPSFLKWYNGSFSQPGIGGLDSGVLPSGGCIGAQHMGSISYIDVLRLYLLTFTCGTATAVPPHGAWYFSTATSLDLQDWTVPQMVANSQFPLYTPCPGSTADGASFDGWYSSYMSPNSAPGHIGLSGSVFFLNGCDTSSDRKFMSRTFSITAGPGADNYQGLWWAAPAGSESGWGINFAHQGDTIFASWFTYDATGNGWWLVMTATKTGNGMYSGTLYQLTGPPFNSVPFPPIGSPGGAVAAAVGSGTLTFSDANNGSFAYAVNGISQTKAITREVFGTVPACIYGAQPDFALATNYQDLWWAVPAGSEAGWGINLTHDGDTIFATWFTYDQNRTPMWLVVTANKTAPGTYSGSQVFRLTGPPFSSVPFPPQGSPGGATGINVGTAKFTFSDGNTGTFMYTVNGITQTKNITRELFHPPAGTVCGAG
jgi:hypothetical protein